VSLIKAEKTLRERGFTALSSKGEEMVWDTSFGETVKPPMRYAGEASQVSHPFGVPTPDDPCLCDLDLIL